MCVVSGMCTCHPGDAPQHGRGAHHGVEAGRDAVVTRGTLAGEQPHLRIVVSQLLHTYTKIM